MQPINALTNQASPATAASPASTGLALKDIHLPEQISDFPIAYGWWILVTLLITMTALIIIKTIKVSKQNKVKKQALKHLNSKSNISDNDIIALLKWAAMHYFSRVELAKLYGDSLQQFFLSKLATKYQQRFTDLSKEAFENQYQAKITSSDNFQQAAQLWLTQALPPKKTDINTSTYIINQQSQEQGQDQGVSL
ncbi:MAG: DUF4381 domain-containing protein [Colwellia sp.]|nr:DUF4381 domain-containing protein [Colwellia sp.]